MLAFSRKHPNGLLLAQSTINICPNCELIGPDFLLLMLLCLLACIVTLGLNLSGFFVEDCLLLSLCSSKTNSMFPQMLFYIVSKTWQHNWDYHVYFINVPKERCVVQLVIMFTKVRGFFHVTSITWEGWLYSVLVGAGSWPVAFMVKLWAR